MVDKKKLHCHIDGVSGIAGDMLLSALIDAGADIGKINRSIDQLFDGHVADITSESVVRYGLAAQHLKIKEIQAPVLRHWSTIRALISQSKLPASIKGKAIEILGHLAKVEADVHNIPEDNVHFHEIGAIDTLVDIVGSLVALDDLNIGSISAAPVNLGGGAVKIDHGLVPVPAPATAALSVGIPTYGEDDAGELATPTGMALIAGLATKFGEMPAQHIQKIGYGAGTKDRKNCANVVRVILGFIEETRGPSAPFKMVIEISANIDDQTPEQISYVIDRLFELGALDVWQQPIFMKKGRMGVKLSCLVFDDLEHAATDFIFKETTSLGVRCQKMWRHTLERTIITVETEFGDLPVKISKNNGDIMTISPEYEPAQRLAKKLNLPLKIIMHAATNAAHKQLER